jgi:hypothetical protein
MSAIKLGAVVGDGGRVELTVPFPAGTEIEITVHDSKSADEVDEVEWNDDLQERLDALDRGEIDPRPWREVLDEIRSRLTNRTSAS